MQTYLFYDIETTGLNKAFDQILQFAAIRTDLNLNELNRYELKVKLNRDIIPSPEAIITHGIGIKEAEEGISEIEAVKQIHQWLNTPGTISLGYNTLGFDDEFLRFSFYRNLLPPYTHQYANQCSRMDIYPMTVMFYLFKNSILKWPEKNGKISLKLEELNHINQFVSGKAHHAMVDVEATLSLTKTLFNDREMWNYLTGYFNKERDEARLKQFEASETLMVDGFFGAENYYQCPVISIGKHNHYKNQTLWLKLDSEHLMKTSLDTIAETTRVIHKKLGEPSFILPFKSQYLIHLTKERYELMETNKAWLKENTAIFSKIMEYHKTYLYPTYPETDIDASLYLNGFWTREEENFCRQFHMTSSAEEKSLLAKKITNPKLKALVIRLLGRHYPESMSNEQAESFEKYLQKIRSKESASILIDYRGEKRLTPNFALQEIKRLKQTRSLDLPKIKLLDELENYLNLT